MELIGCIDCQQHTFDAVQSFADDHAGHYIVYRVVGSKKGNNEHIKQQQTRMLIHLLNAEGVKIEQIH